MIVVMNTLMACLFNQKDSLFLFINNTPFHLHHLLNKQNKPGAAQPVNRPLLRLSWSSYRPPVLTSSILTSSIAFRHLIEWFTFVRLPEPHLLPSCGNFSSTLTTMALYHSSLRWFEAYSCKATSRGPPSFLIQLQARGSPKKRKPCASSWHTVTRLS